MPPAISMAVQYCLLKKRSPFNISDVIPIIEFILIPPLFDTVLYYNQKKTIRHKDFVEQFSQNLEKMLLGIEKSALMWYNLK